VQLLVTAAAQILGKEQFVAMYLTSGVVASLGSHMHKLFLGSTVPSLGAVRSDFEHFVFNGVISH